jgi:Ca2+-binding EF-hand superfamily protein
MSKKYWILTLIFSGLTACAAPVFQSPLNTPSSVRSLSTPTSTLVKARSDQGLDQVSIQFRDMMFVGLDKNKDGFLSTQEALLQEEADFLKFDTNRDRKISKPEFLNPAVNARATFSREEIRNFASAFWSRITPYGIPLDFEQFWNAHKPTLIQPGSENRVRQEVRLTFNQTDRNLDGRITFSEYEDYFALSLWSMQQSPIPVAEQ